MDINNHFQPGDIVRCIEKNRSNGKHFGNLYTVKRVALGCHIYYKLVGNYGEKLELPQHELEMVIRPKNITKD